MPNPTPHRSHTTRRDRPAAGAKPSRKDGAWLPWPVVERLVRLDLGPPSHWRVFVAVLCKAARYGRGEAFLTVDALAQMTGLAPRTVKAALGVLKGRGLLTRPTRCGRIRVPWLIDQEAQEGAITSAPTGPTEARARGASMSAPPRCKHVCPSPTSSSISSLLNDGSDRGPFSPKQHKLIADVLVESTQLLGQDVGELTLPAGHAVRLGLTESTTYVQALATIMGGGSRTQARDFTGAVLALRQDPRVQGVELNLS
jgi:hypothetical protein